MRMIFGIGAAGLIGWGVALAETAPLELRGERIALTLGREEKGAVVSLKTREGAELAAVSKGARLFSLTFSQQAQVPVETLMLSSADAAAFNAEVKDDAGGPCATLTYEGFAKGVARVICTVRVKPGDAMARWGIRVQMQEGWVLERVQYPFVTLAAQLGTSAEDDAAVVGSA